MIIPALTNFQSFYDNAPLTSVTWILSAYLAIIGVTITPLTGKLGDIYGKKRVLVPLLSTTVAVSIARVHPDIGSLSGSRDRISPTC